MSDIYFFALFVLAVGHQSVFAQCHDPNLATLGSVVRVQDSSGGAASGVVVSSGLILTAAHVVDSGGTFRIEQALGRSRNATLVSIDIENDLALLASDTDGIPAVAISNRRLGAGDQVWAAGYPRNGNLMISEGNFQNEARGRLHTNAYIDSGQSGGALFRCRGGKHELAGIVHGYVAMVHSTGFTNTGDSISIPSATLQSFLKGAL